MWRGSLENGSGEECFGHSGRNHRHQHTLFLGYHLRCAFNLQMRHFLFNIAMKKTLNVFFYFKALDSLCKNAYTKSTFDRGCTQYFHD